MNHDTPMSVKHSLLSAGAGAAVALAVLLPILSGKNREIALNEFTVGGKKVDIGKITTVAVKTVEGANDDISAPGQCVAALDLLTGLPASKKASHIEPGAGHYGIFAGKSWRNNIRPLVLDFIDANAGGPANTPKAPAKRKASVKKTAPKKTAAK